MNEKDLAEVAKTLDQDLDNIHSHALWMARVISDIHRDPGFRRLRSDLREEVENICTAIE